MDLNIRAFIAVKITPDPELLELINYCRKVFENEAIKWVDEDNMHLTLKFLGETPRNQVSEVKNILESICEKYSGFSFKLEGLSYFKSKGQPRVLFTNVHNFEGMRMLVRDLEELLFDLGFEKETREFKPHLTLGRIKLIKEKKRFFRFVEKYKSQTFQIVDVSEVIFYQSILKPTGPEYIPLKIVQLKP